MPFTWPITILSPVTKVWGELVAMLIGLALVIAAMLKLVPTVPDSAINARSIVCDSIIGAYNSCISIFFITNCASTFNLSIAAIISVV